MISALIFITGIIPYACQAQLTAGEDCNLQSIASCTEGFVSLSRTAIPKNLEETCRILQEAFACIGRKSDACIRNEGIMATLQGITAKVNDMCSPQSKMRMAYDKHRQCIDSITNEYRQCEAQLQDVLARPDKDEEQSLAKRCCGINQLTDCVISVTTEKCGTDAANFPKEALRIDQSSSVYETPCKRYNAGGLECQSYTSKPTEPSGNSGTSPGTPPGTPRTSATSKPKGNQGISLMVSFDLLVFTILAFVIIV